MEREDFNEFLGVLVVLPERIVVDKCDYAGVCICLILNASRLNPKEDAVCGNGTRRSVIDLDRLSVEVQKHDSVIVIAHAVELFHMVELRITVPVRRADQIIRRDGARLLIDLADRRHGFSIDLRSQGSPCHLIECRLQIDLREGVVVDRIIRLEIRI